MFEALGAKYVSADGIVHELLVNGTDAWREVVREFGDEILLPDLEIDRRKLGVIVFNDSEKRRRLEEIVHPRVFSRLAEIARDYREHCSGILILEIPLLIETSFYEEIDKIVVVVSEQETQISRLQKRCGMDRETAIRRLASQMPTTEKIRYADWVISTNTTLAATSAQVERVYAAAQKLLAQGN
jgi:dephospho-CoA kinase